MDLTPDQRLAAHARRRHRVVSRPELLALGFDDGMIRTREARGQLHRQWRGVWSVGTADLSPEGRCLAAVLAVGDGAVASHRTAAILWGVRDPTWGLIELSCARDVRPRDGLRCHWSGTLDRPHAVTWRRGVPVTGVARTLLDLADVVGRSPLEAAIDRALARDLLRAPVMERVLADAFGRHGTPVLREALGLTLTRSELERMFAGLVAGWELPRAETNVVVAGWELDCWWPAHRLAVELDGWRFHRTRRSFEADHDRDLSLRAHGIHVLRLTYRQLTRRPAAVEAALRTELRAPGAAGPGGL